MKFFLFARLYLQHVEARRYSEEEEEEDNFFNNMFSVLFLGLNLKFYLAYKYIQHNTTDTEHMLIMNARTPVITKMVDAAGRPLALKLQNTVYLYSVSVHVMVTWTYHMHGVHNNNLINNKKKSR